MSGVKKKSIWDLSTDGNDSPEDGTVSSSSRLGVHVSAKIHQLQTNKSAVKTSTNEIVDTYYFGKDIIQINPKLNEKNTENNNLVNHHTEVNHFTKNSNYVEPKPAKRNSITDRYLKNLSLFEKHKTNENENEEEEISEAESAEIMKKMKTRKRSSLVDIYLSSLACNEIELNEKSNNQQQFHENDNNTNTNDANNQNTAKGNSEANNKNVTKKSEANNKNKTKNSETNSRNTTMSSEAKNKDTTMNSETNNKNTTMNSEANNKNITKSSKTNNNKFTSYNEVQKVARYSDVTYNSSKSAREENESDTEVNEEIKKYSKKRSSIAEKYLQSIQQNKQNETEINKNKINNCEEQFLPDNFEFTSPQPAPKQKGILKRNRTNSERSTDLEDNEPIKHKGILKRDRNNSERSTDFEDEIIDSPTRRRVIPAPRFSLPLGEDGIQETIHLKTITTPDQTLEVTLTVSDVTTLQNKQKRVAFDTSDTGSRRGSILLDSNLIHLDDDHCELCRRNSFHHAQINHRPSVDFKPVYKSEIGSDSKRGSFFSNDNLEAVSLKLDAIVVNSEYLERQAQNEGSDTLEIEEDLMRTECALEDIALLQDEVLQERIARAARAVARCKLVLEEKAPNISIQEPGYRRRGSSVSDQMTKNVSLRVLAIENQTRNYNENRRGSIEYV